MDDHVGSSDSSLRQPTQADAPKVRGGLRRLASILGSGVCLSLAAIGFFLVTKNKPIGSLLLVWAILISYSRIYLGAHYPLDVIMGAIVGGIGAFTLFQAYAKLTKKS